MVLAALTGDDIVVCQITSRAIADGYAIPITAGDFTSGGLRQESNARPNRLFTADSAIILYQAGTLSTPKVEDVISRVVDILRA